MAQVKLFAQARDLAGSAEVTLPQAVATVAQLRRELTQRLPALASLVARSAIAVNGVYATDDTPLGPDDELALIPPVSGGQR